ncbi:hypothetical protein [Actinoplanes sp. RD1]|uniref:hypothetical protein n=1 Tax=Actinoplanes sp. RD1 TaxID=3064538 RepID=UPI00274273E4|nr:hypothetical protein [Actinoplanes sp. RD1]
MTYPPQEQFPPAPPPNTSQPTAPLPAPPPYPPVSATPYPAPPERRRPTVLVLSIAAALLLVFGGLMLGLYLNEHGNLNDTKGNLRDTRADLTAQVEEQKSIVTSTQQKLADAEKKTGDLTSQLGTTKTDLAETKSQRDALVPCMRRIQDAFDAAANGDGPGVDRALRSARSSCDKAEIKVDS